jgi:hypothetical protein
MRDDPSAPSDVRITRLAMRQYNVEAVLLAHQEAAKLLAHETKRHMSDLHDEAMALIKQLGDDVRAWRAEMDTKRRKARRRT